jgi:hypothetical protein
MLGTALAVIAVAACGSSSHSSTAGTTTAAGVSTAANSDALQAARVKATVCLRSQGINIPDLTPGGGRLVQATKIIAGYPPARVQAAEKVCQSELKQAFPNLFNLSSAQIAQRRQQALAFAQCLRSHGIYFPDPTSVTSNPAAYIQTLTALSNTPAYEAAAPGCRTQALKASGGG